MTKPINNIATFKERKPDPTGPTRTVCGDPITNAYEQNHDYLSHPSLWPQMFVPLIRRHDAPVFNHPNFLGAKEVGICMQSDKGWRVYLGVSFIIIEELRRGKDPEHIDYASVNALLDDGWEVD